MAKNQGPNGSSKSPVVRALPQACLDELSAVEFFENQRWPAGAPTCPHCQRVNSYKMTDAKTGERSKRFLWRCRECKKQYTVRVGTIMEDSKIPVRHWALAFWRACSSKKGVSAKQIQRETGVSYESALFMMHRIRFAMTDQGPQAKLSGVVECDETYVGGKPRVQDGTGNATRLDRKTPVFALVQRDGKVRAMTMARVTVSNLHAAIVANVERTADLMTDEAAQYRSIGVQFASHGVVTHSKKEYARGSIHTNTVEGFFSLLKRSVYGTYHSVSKGHLHRYVAQAAYLYNTRKLDDGQRVTLAIHKAQGKRLVYRTPA